MFIHRLASIAVRCAGQFVVLCVAVILVACADAPRGSTELPPGIKTLRVNGYDLAYAERGSGVPLVLVHGALSDYRSWEPQMVPFGERYRVYALSMRHYYPERWDGKGTTFNVQQQADDVIEFVRRLGAGKVHLVAHSRGGNIALHVAKKAPELLKTLVLADPSGLEGLLPPGGPGENDANQMRVRVTERFRAGDVEGGLRMYAEFTTGKGAWEQLSESQRQLRRDNAWTVVADTDRPRTTCDEGKRYTMPVLFVNGENSPKRYPVMSRAFAACLRDARVETVPVASHGMFRTHPEQTNRVVLEFLARHP